MVAVHANRVRETRWVMGSMSASVLIALIGCVARILS